MKITDSGMPVEELWASFFSPQEILIIMGLTEEMKQIVDLGCGYGTFDTSKINSARFSKGMEIMSFTEDNFEQAVIDLFKTTTTLSVNNNYDL
jgi:hypothetical protein